MTDRDIQYIREALSKIGCLENFERNRMHCTKLYNGENPYEFLSLFSSINYSFAWGSTMEGYYYWLAKNHKISKILQDELNVIVSENTE